MARVPWRLDSRSSFPELIFITGYASLQPTRNSKYREVVSVLWRTKRSVTLRAPTQRVPAAPIRNVPLPDGPDGRLRPPHPSPNPGPPWVRGLSGTPAESGGHPGARQPPAMWLRPRRSHGSGIRGAPEVDGRVDGEMCERREAELPIQLPIYTLISTGIRPALAGRRTPPDLHF